MMDVERGDGVGPDLAAFDAAVRSAALTAAACGVAVDVDAKIYDDAEDRPVHPVRALAHVVRPERAWRGGDYYAVGDLADDLGLARNRVWEYVFASQSSIPESAGWRPAGHRLRRWWLERTVLGVWSSADRTITAPVGRMRFGTANRSAGDSPEGVRPEGIRLKGIRIEGPVRPVVEF